MRSSWIVSLVIVCAVLFAGASAQGGAIGFNFSGGWQSGPFNLAASDTAGVVPQQNWNNWMGAAGQTNWNYTNIALVDDTGAASTAKAQIGPYFGQNDGPGPGNNTGGIQTLYGGKTREGNGGNWTATFSAIPYLKYDVYAYTTQNETIAVSGAATGNGSQALTYGGSIASYVQGSNYLKWSGVSGTSFTIASTSGNYANVNAFQIVQASKPIISVIDGGWGDGPTWDLNPITPVGATDYDVTVRHAVSFAETAQVVSSLTLDNVNSNMTIPIGAGLTGASEVSLGTLQVNGGLTASTLKVSGGSATLASTSSGTIGTLNVTAGSATAAVGSAHVIGTLGASGGTTSLGVNLGTALNVSGTGIVNTAAAVSVPTVAVSGGSLDTTGGPLSATTVAVSGGSANLQGGTIGTLNASAGTTTIATSVGILNASGVAIVNGGAGMGAGTAALSGSSVVNTQGNYMAIGNTIKMPNGTTITVTGGPTVDLKGADLGAMNIGAIKLKGGIVTIGGPPAAAVYQTKANSGWMTGSANSLAGVAFTPGANGMLIAMVGGEGAPSITSVSWTPTGGAAILMTEAVKQNAGNVLSGIWYLPSAMTGTDGAGTLSYVLSGNPSRAMIGGVYATGVDQLALPTFASVSGNFPQTAGPIAANAGSLVVSSGTNGTTGVTGGILSGGDTTLWNLTGSTGMGASYKISTGGTESGKWNTPTSTGIANIASFTSAGAAPFSFDLASTVVEIADNTTLDLGLATSASFFDVFLEVGVTTPKTLHLTGANWGVVSGLASFFDLTAPNNANVSWIGDDGATYVDLSIVPEPGTLVLLGMGGLGLLAYAWRRRRA